MATTPTPPFDPDTIAVSPRFRLSKLLSGRLEDKIDVFQDQVNGWILDHAEALTSSSYAGSDHSGWAVLILALSYFESIAAFQRGESSENRSKEFFGAGLRGVFPAFEPSPEDMHSKAVADILDRCLWAFYNQLRCGLFHESAMRNRVIVRRQDDPLMVAIHFDTHDVLGIYVDPVSFLGEVRRHFRAYVIRLRDEAQTQLRANFEREWDRRANRPGPLLAPLTAQSTAEGEGA